VVDYVEKYLRQGSASHGLAEFLQPVSNHDSKVVPTSGGGTTSFTWEHDLLL
jgi:hypothetical protein